MKRTTRITSALLLATGLTLAAVPVLHAESEFRPGMPGMMGKHCPMGEMGYHGMKGHHGGERHGRKADFLKGLNLTEAQQDKIFEIKYALEPAKRTYHKEIRKLRGQQRELELASTYDSGKMKKLIEQETKLTAEHRLSMADARNKMYQVLTDEQRKQVADRQAARKPKPDA